LRQRYERDYTIASPEESRLTGPNELPRSARGRFVDFLLFRKMITPVILQMVFWLGTAGCVAMGALFINSSLQAGESGLIGVVYGCLLLFGGPIGVRIACELLIVLFRIHEALNKIAHRTESVSRG